MNLNATKLGLSIGIIWGLALILLTIMSGFLDWGTEFVNLLGTVYLGYKVSIVGAIIGGIWGLVDGFIGGFLVAWLYNKL